MLNINKELEERYLNVEKNANEIVLLTKMIEEAGEFSGAISGMICEMAGQEVGSWKGKDKNYRQEMLHEWMDLYRLMYVWFEHFTTEEEKEEMWKLNEEKITKFVEKKEKEQESRKDIGKLTSAIEKLFENYRFSDNDIASMFGVDPETVAMLREQFVNSKPEESATANSSGGVNISDRGLAWVCYNLILTDKPQDEIAHMVNLTREAVYSICHGKRYTSRLIEMGFMEEGSDVTEMMKARKGRRFPRKKRNDGDPT